METNLKVGIKKTIENVVTFTETANNIGSGTLNVLATPVMISWMENASMKAVSDCLPEGCDTVGIKIDVLHIASTPVGMKVRIETELIEIDGKKLIFKVEAYDDREKIGEGTHERVIINIEKFLDKAKKKFLAK